MANKAKDALGGTAAQSASQLIQRIENALQQAEADSIQLAQENAAKIDNLVVANEEKESVTVSKSDNNKQNETNTQYKKTTEEKTKPTKKEVTKPKVSLDEQARQAYNTGDEATLRRLASQGNETAKKLSAGLPGQKKEQRDE